MAATDTLNSIDAQIAQVRREYESEITALKNELVQVKSDAAAARDMLEREAAKASAAIQTAATLMAHFGTVSKVFDDARTVAEKAKALFGQLEAKAAAVAPTVVKEVEAVTSESVKAVETALHMHLDPANASSPSGATNVPS